MIENPTICRSHKRGGGKIYRQSKKDPVQVGGISCTDAYICHPKPTEVEEEMVSWAVPGGVAAMEATQAYEVCYCAGPCFAASHWTKVPGSFSVGPYASPDLGRIGLMTPTED